MSYQALDVTRDGAVTWLSLNRPQSLNALNAAITDELHDFVAGLIHDRITRVVVMRGAGRAFCAGLDLKEQGGSGVGKLGHSVTGTFEMQRRLSSLVIAIRRVPQPLYRCRPRRRFR